MKNRVAYKKMSSRFEQHNWVFKFYKIFLSSRSQGIIDASEEGFEATVQLADTMMTSEHEESEVRESKSKSSFLCHINSKNYINNNS